MLTLFKAGLVAVGAAALVCAPAVANAAYTFSDRDMGTPQASAPEEATREVQYAPSAKALDIPRFGNLHGNADLLLWNLCAVVRAQQGRRAFDLIDSEIRTVRISEDIAKVSAVPLPGAAWLFVMGVMGLAGTRVTGIKNARRSQPTDAAGRDIRAWPQRSDAIPV